MQVSELKALVAANKLRNVNFIESGCGPIVVEIEHADGRELLKNDEGENLTLKNLEQGYSLCQRANIHSAYLLHTVPHDEACSGLADYQAARIPLKF